jgi:hypothetical protein
MVTAPSFCGVKSNLSPVYPTLTTLKPKPNRLQLFTAKNTSNLITISMPCPILARKSQFLPTVQVESVN